MKGGNLGFTFSFAFSSSLIYLFPSSDERSNSNLHCVKVPPMIVIVKEGRSQASKIWKMREQKGKSGSSEQTALPVKVTSSDLTCQVSLFPPSEPLYTSISVHFV